jgi:hypothetical protein
MGYRSDVKIAFYVRLRDMRTGKVGREYAKGLPHATYGALKLWFDENFPSHEFAHYSYFPDEGAIVVSYENIKWYDGYPEVTAVEQAIGRFRDTFLVDDKKGLGSYEFVRIGEEDADVFVDRSDWSDYMLGVVREIGVNFGGME